MSVSATTDAQRISIFFYKQTHSTVQSGKGDIPVNWFKLAQTFLDKTKFSLEEAKDFIAWVLNENISEIPQFNSVVYLANANDPFATLMKNLDGNLIAYKRKQSVKAKVNAAEISSRVKVDPLPREIALWLMLGPGVNTPVERFTSAHEKLDAIKHSWYHEGWESAPDPITLEEAQERFDAYNSSIGKK